jgi:Carbohydrate-selective porin, OprB family/S-layer homology domain
MFHQLRSSLLLAPALLGFMSLSAVAEQAPANNPALDQVANYGSQVSPEKGATTIGQVTSVSQLSDVRPSDWAFQALQSLVERYGCIAGYPDKTFRGNRALTRYEFAAGLNACLTRVNELIAASTADMVKKEDIETLKKLTEEYKADLEVIRGQVDGLEARTTTLEKQQFSTTTKLNGEVILTLSEAFGGDRAINSDQQRTIDAATTAAAKETATAAAIGTGTARRVQDNAIVANRVRLSFDTSFTGKDRLRTRLQAANINNFSGAVTGTNMTRLGYEANTSNTVELNRLEYRFPLGSQTTVFLGGGKDGLEFNDSVPTLSPFESSGSGSISRFGRFNPIYRANSGTGLIINHKLGREFTTGSKFTLSVGYLVPTAEAETVAVERGLFSGKQSTALAQLVFQPTPNIGLGFTYASSYYDGGSGLTGSTGSGFANSPFGANIATYADQFGVQGNIRLSPKLTLAGWAGITNATAKESSGTNAATNVVNKGDDANIVNWAVGLAMPDLFKEGNLGAIIFGMPPKVTSSDFGPSTLTATTARREDSDTSYHLEAFYRYKLNDNISITPGLLVIFNPEHNSANDTQLIGTLRTTFTF